MWMENVKNFQIAKCSASGCYLVFAFFFCQFQPGIAYKSVAYLKKHVAASIMAKITSFSILEVLCHYN